MKGRLTLMWRRLSPLEFGKDVILVPKTLAESLGMEAEIVCGWDDSLSEAVRSASSETLHFTSCPLGYSPRQRMPRNVRFLLGNAGKTDVLMCFHWRPETILNILVYKLVNPRGRIYVKLDTISGREFDLSRCGKIGRVVRRCIYRLALRHTDVLSCETTQAMENLRSSGFPGLDGKLVLLPNPVDLPDVDVAREKMFLTVGRLGTDQKNTEMILRALEGLDLGDWKFIFAGPCENGFKAPDIPGVEFIGPVTDRGEMAALMAKAAAFVLSSRWESYGIVLAEAAASGCYIISTDVGAARDIIACVGGSLVPQDDASALRAELQNMIDGKYKAAGRAAADTIISNYEDSLSSLSRILRR